MEEKHWNIRNDFLKVDDPEGSKFIIPAAMPKMSETPPRIRWTYCQIGQDNEKIYRKYGLTE
jgi:crotonobetainyl-CoA:carnitine CoA-transferase CaiB-like acyl-CoA transferase